MISGSNLDWAASFAQGCAVGPCAPARRSDNQQTTVSKQSIVLVCCFATALAAQQREHWSYQPVASQPNSVKLGRAATLSSAFDWSKSKVDGLVLKAMKDHGLEPSPPATKDVWLRRVTLDLTGLPPTIAQLEDFVEDRSEGARERVVDRLFGSDAFAERWTSWWLDLARYADSQGYEKDSLRRSMWRYRDWVIDAFRSDMPFDEFTVMQLAGDLLPDATVDQQLATAFHRQTMTNTEGGTDNEEFRVAAVVDRVDTTMSVWMGSTLGCAQCHDHKYDPFSQKEFFELFAFFDQTEDADRDNDEPTLRAPTSDDHVKFREVAVELKEARAALAAQESVLPTMTPWHLLGPVKGNGFKDARDREFAPEREGVLLQVEQEGQKWRKRTDLVDGKVHTWTGENSAFYLHRVLTSDKAGKIVFSLGSDDSIAVWWNGQQVLKKNVARGAAADQEMLDLDLVEGENELLLKVINGGGVGGFYFQVWGAGEGDLRERIQKLQQVSDQHLGPKVPILRELPLEGRRTTRIHNRGSFLDQGDVVEPGTPAIWPAMGQDWPRNRLGLARWLMSRNNPLTARVLSNRIWSELFGQGIVLTLEDFGSQGDKPSHPELLDVLAADFMDSGWSMRHLLRTIVLSATYAQSSVQTAVHREADPNNQWLSRGPAFRLSAEQLRDQAIAVAGLLHEEVGGKSVMPPQPDGIWRQIYSGAKWADATGKDRFRRALYTTWRRTSPHPAMLMFDAQSREACVLRRRRTNTPLQALVLWNDPQFFEPARALGLLAKAASGSDPDRGVAWIWRRCLLREPTSVELKRLVDLLNDEIQRGVPDDDAWGIVSSVVLCLDEFVTKR